VKKPTRTAQLDDTALLKLVWEIPRHWRLAMDRRLKPLGLSDAKWRTVLHLSRGPRGMSQAELASRLNIEAPTVARLLDRLAADGWIERRAAANDRRIKTVHLLPKASGVIKQIDRTMNATRDEILGGLSKSELRACIATLQKVRARAEHAATQANGSDR
jgi:MarR family transcriptional regulator for hemolysin